MGRRFRRLHRLRNEVIRITRRLFRVCFCCGTVKESYRVEVVPVAKLTSDSLGDIVEDSSCSEQRHGDECPGDDDSLNLSDWESTGSVNSLFLSPSEILNIDRPAVVTGEESDLCQSDVILSGVSAEKGELNKDRDCVPNFPTDPGSFFLTYSDWNPRCENYPSGWRILNTISEGRFGKVQLALLEETQSMYLTKTINVETSSEDRLLMYCQSPFVTKLHSVLSTESQRLLILPNYQYGDLGSLMERDKSRMFADESTVVWVASKLYAALKFIHTEKILHLDIRPTNILIDDKGYPIIANFGRAQIYDEVNEKTSYTPTPCYTSPEILRNEQPDGMADLWSVACCLYQLLLRCVPYPGQTPDECLVRISLGLPHNLRDLSLKVMDFLAFELHPSRRQRLGYQGGVASVMKHRLFNGINWDVVCLGGRFERSPLLDVIDTLDENSDIYDFFDEDPFQRESNRPVEYHGLRGYTGLSPLTESWSVRNDMYYDHTVDDYMF